MDMRRMSRRAAMRALGAGGLALSLPLLAACGGSAGTAATASGVASSSAATTVVGSTTAPSSAVSTASATNSAAASSTATTSTASVTGAAVATGSASKALGSVEFWSPWTGPQYEGPTGMIARIDAAFNAKHPDL